MRAEKFYPELREIAKEFLDCLVGPVMGNRVVLLVPYEKSAIDYDERVHILTKTRNMVYKLETRTDSRFRAGIGRIKEEDNLRESYSEALQALREADSHVVHVNDIPTGKENEEDYPEELENPGILRNAMEKRYMPEPQDERTKFLNGWTVTTAVLGRKCRYGLWNWL